MPGIEESASNFERIFSSGSPFRRDRYSGITLSTIARCAGCIEPYGNPPWMFHESICSEKCSTLYAGARAFRAWMMSAAEPLSGATRYRWAAGLCA
jgi:hypothetical protein